MTKWGAALAVAVSLACDPVGFTPFPDDTDLGEAEDVAEDLGPVEDPDTARDGGPGPVPCTPAVGCEPTDCPPESQGCACAPGREVGTFTCAPTCEEPADCPPAPDVDEWICMFDVVAGTAVCRPQE